MCGIFFYNKTSSLIDSSILLRNLKHRGPDAEKVLTTEDVVMGHTLLSIRDEIDKSIASNQFPWKESFLGGEENFLGRSAAPRASLELRLQAKTTG